MSVSQRKNGTWIAQVNFNGKQYWGGTYPTKRAAVRGHAEKLAQRQRESAQTSITVERLGEEWLAECTEHCRDARFGPTAARRTGSPPNTAA